MKKYALIYQPQNADGSYDDPKMFYNAKNIVDHYKKSLADMGWKILAVIEYDKD